MSVPIIALCTLFCVGTLSCAELPAVHATVSNNFLEKVIVRESIEDLEKLVEDTQNFENHIRGCVLLAEKYYQGDGVQSNHEKARILYEKIVRQLTYKRAQVWAMYWLGKIYVQGQWSGKIRRYGERPVLDEMSKNSATGLSYFERAAEQNEEMDIKDLACLELGDLYVEGRVVPKDVNRARKYYELIIDQRQGSKATELARERLKKINNRRVLPRVTLPIQAELPAVVETNTRYQALVDEGEKHCQKKQFEKARECFEEAASQDVEPRAQAQACLALGKLYQCARGVPCNLDIASGNYEKAAEQEHDMSAQVQACKLLAELWYAWGDVTQDYQKSLHYLERAARPRTEIIPGQPAVWCRLGYIFTYGPEALRNYEKGRQFYKQAADQTLDRHVQAQARLVLGEIFAAGQGVPVNEIKAREYFEMVIEQQDSLASQAMGYFALGRLLFLGQGVKQDLVLAEKYLQKAADQGMSLHAQIRARFYLGKLFRYLFAQSRSCELKERAIEYYGYTADQVIERKLQAQAWLGLGDCYRELFDVSEKHIAQKMRAFYEKAAQQEVCIDTRAEANMHLAEACEYGWGGLPTDFAKMKRHYEAVTDMKTAHRGFQAKAWAELERIYTQGLGVPRNPVKAVECRTARLKVP